jgi:CHASE2 domain-containing sensor protein
MTRWLAALGALAAAALLSLLPIADRIEQRSIDLRFQVRGSQPADGIAVVAIDEATINELNQQWPFPRSLHARALDALRRAGARQVVYDVQFTEPTKPREDLALFDAVARAHRVVLASGESDERGRTRVLGGDAGLHRVGATAAAANLPGEAGGVIRRYEPAVDRLPTIAATVARRLGRHPSRHTELIDFRGPPGTVPTVSFADLIAGRVPPAELRGRVVVIGATAATLQDLHPTSGGGDELMAGPEIQASAIWTALHGNPLQEAPGQTGWVLLLVLGLGGAAAVSLLGPVRGCGAAVLVGAAYAGAVQLLFDDGTVLPVVAPLGSLVLTTAAATLAAVASETAERRRVAAVNELLEAAVQERTQELELTQLEAIERLARAAELRDDDTGEHIERMSALCERVSLELGDSPADAARLRCAAILHDVGKIGLPDVILGKPGKLTPEEITEMRRHAAFGAALLAGSRSPIMALAEVVARTHHERWDGSGYPLGIKGAKIPRPGRIAAVCDVWDALVSERPYKRAWTFDEARTEIVAQRGRHFDPEIADALLRVVDRANPPFRADVAQETAAASVSGVPSSAASARSTDAATQVKVGVSRFV